MRNRNLILIIFTLVAIGCTKFVPPKCAEVVPGKYQPYCFCSELNYSDVKDSGSTDDEMFLITVLPNTSGDPMNQCNQRRRYLWQPKKGAGCWAQDIKFSEGPRCFLDAFKIEKALKGEPVE